MYSEQLNFHRKQVTEAYTQLAELIDHSEVAKLRCNCYVVIIPAEILEKHVNNLQKSIANLVLLTEKPITESLTDNPDFRLPSWKFKRTEE